ncbi:unnamed protein product [Linum trigynum]|uniref:F-box domain-containing protein n=1 Tax=Linum trigynum TaxID=586398 RepID=A0AAV2F2J9_9ROSI
MELGESTVDRISNVPANVIEHILMLLPIKDAGRTSILSRNWRHHWRSIPQLVFDGSFAPPLPSTEPYLPDEKKVMMDIYEALLLHDGPVTKFELSIPGLREDCPRICKLIPHVGSKGVQELALRFSVGQTKLPSSLFTACHLTVLKLQHCSVGAPSSFVGFRKLVVLELEHVIMPEDFLQKLQPECPLLEELRVLYCSDQNYDIEAPSLKVLLFHNHVSNTVISFNNVPVLSVLSILDGWRYTDWFKTFASLPAIRQLTFGIHSLQFSAKGNVPYKLPTILYQLKFLEVTRLLLDNLPQAQVLICLIMSSPNLQKLSIRLGTNNAQPSSEVMGSLQELLEAEERQGICCLQLLEEFNIQDSQGTQVELDLVRFVLATAPQLRMILIKRAVNLSSDKVLGFLNELVSYKRISKDAEVKYV